MLVVYNVSVEVEVAYVNDNQNISEYVVSMYWVCTEYVVIGQQTLIYMLTRSVLHLFIFFQLPLFQVWIHIYASCNTEQTHGDTQHWSV